MRALQRSTSLLSISQRRCRALSCSQKRPVSLRLQPCCLGHGGLKTATQVRHNSTLPQTQNPSVQDQDELESLFNDYVAGRIVFPRSQWGVATPSVSEQFKQRKLSGNLKKSKRWDDLFSIETKNRVGSSLKDASKYLSTPGLISLGGGLPSSEYIPFEGLSIKVPTAESVATDTKAPPVSLDVGKNDFPEEKGFYDVATAFNYGQGSGSAQLLRWITEHTEMVHRPPYLDWACTMTVGSTSALDVTLRLLTQPGEYIISEEYAFATAVETAAPMGVKVAGVAMDEQGLLPSALDELLTHWDEKKRGAARPKILYTVPSGQNPTGATQGVERRQEIYKVCQKHDLYIIEDEPYYFLQMPAYSPNQTEPSSLSHNEFLKGLIPSLLSMDVDGRVMRMDSFSKVMAPGSRIGWITASEQIVERYKLHAELSTQGPSGISQLVLYKLLDEHWGHGGYLDWLAHIRRSYTKRRNILLAACERHLPRDIVSWNPPRAGMFLWLQINWKQHPSFGKKSLEQIEEEIFHATIRHGALAMRGSWFHAENDVQHETMFFRVTYAAATSDKMDEAIRRFGVAVREAFGRKV